jgi:uncharacterized protein (DUF983 family)
MREQESSTKPALAEYLKTSLIIYVSGMLTLFVMWINLQVLPNAPAWSTLIVWLLGFTIPSILVIIIRVAIYWKRYQK